MTSIYFNQIDSITTVWCHSQEYGLEFILLNHETYTIHTVAKPEGQGFKIHVAKKGKFTPKI